MQGFYDAPSHQRLGQILRQHGELTSGQICKIVEAQRDSHRPFGDLAERMFGVSRLVVERAWIQQYLSMGTRIDLRSKKIDTSLLTLLKPRQARQFSLLPLWRDGRLLQMVTHEDRLTRAITFVNKLVREPVWVRVADKAQLETYITRYYPYTHQITRQVRAATYPRPIVRLAADNRSLTYATPVSHAAC